MQPPPAGQKVLAVVQVKTAAPVLVGQSGRPPIAHIAIEITAQDSNLKQETVTYLFDPELIRKMLPSLGQALEHVRAQETLPNGTAKH